MCLALAITAACRAADPMPPERKPGIPAEAVWAGGVDGGDWILCVPVATPSRYSCRVYNDYTGKLTASGEFIRRREAGGSVKPERRLTDSATPTGKLHYQYFDGVVIHLEDDVVLVPDGIIDYPFGDGGGKRALFREGVEIGQAAQC